MQGNRGMSDTTFFDVLGVPDHADARAIKRAYAALLKRIDPATDPEGFAHLRQAYEAALDYCATTADSEAIVHVASEAAPLETSEAGAEASTETLAATTTPERPAPPAPSPNDDLAHTLRLADAFAATAQRTPPEQIRPLLAQAISDLRLGYIDAPGRFEERVIDILASGAVSNRPGIFAALTEDFHWNELGHLAPLAARGEWIEAVMGQELAWRQIDLKRRSAILGLLRQAEESLTEDLVRAWPRVREAVDEFPEFLSLYLRPQRSTEWRRRYEAFQAATAPVAEDFSAPRNLRPQRETSAKPFAGMGVVLVVIIAVGRIIGENHVVPHASEASPPPAEVTQPHTADDRAMEGRCISLYVTMDDRQAMSTVSETQRTKMMDEAHLCAMVGFWHRPKGGTRSK